MSALEVRDLVVRYGDVTAVDRVSFAADEGEFVSLLGPSGCGKTTTLRCIAGLDSASAGEIRIGETVVARNGHETPPEQRGVNMVFQSYAVWPHMTVFDNVAYGLRTRGDARAEVTRRTTEALRLVGLEGFAARYGTELSGGQQQRVAVARAVVTEPRLLLFDEPLSNLDAGLRERMRVELLALQRRLGRTSIYVTHDQQEAMAMSDRIILMDRGRIVQQGSPRDLYERPANRFAASFVGNANLLDGEVFASHGQDWFGVRLAGGLELRGLAARPGWQPGADGRALVCIRPENIAPDDSGFAATVTRVSYLGVMQSCEFAAGPLTLRADLPARNAIAEGAVMRLRVDPACVVLVPED
jgi:ABC-type Fe3+/spermidine/putrescine transport system ATPase subunit